MATNKLYPRFVEPRLLEALEDSPVVLVHGPRQCGKTTLARMVGGARGYRYLNFDDEVLRRGAESDPVGFVADLPERVVLDEVQRVPDLFLALKSAVDRRRQPGRFMLTGSSNVLLLPTLADSLAGRMQLLRLHPLTQGELAGQPSAFLQRLFEGEFEVRQTERLGEALLARVAAGGYPAALALPAGRRRAVWYRNYLDALVQRDVRDLTRIRALDVLPRLLALAASQTARLLNVSDLAAPFQLSRPTIADYVTVLERLFLLDVLPPWHSNRLSRLIKAPKLHLGDTGLACALMDVEVAALRADRRLFGQMLETFVVQELRRQASWHEASHQLYHFRDKDGVEVDIVIERGSQHVAGVEVKAAATVTEADFRGLRKLQAAAGDRFAGGVVLYDGEFSVRFGPLLYAVPVRALWEAR